MKITADQSRDVGLAICERLGLDPGQVSDRAIAFEAVGDEVLVRWEGIAFLPAAEVAQILMASTTERPGRVDRSTRDVD